MVLTVLVSPTQQTLIIEKISSESGYTKIKIDEVELPHSYDIVLHVIDPSEILDVINKLEQNINTYDFSINRQIANHKIESLRNKVKTLIPHRHKRGLINLGGNILNWVFGTMDDQDRKTIEKHLNTADENSHAIIQELNQQVKINDNFNKTISLIKSAIESDRIKLDNKINLMNERFSKDASYLEQMIKIDFLERQIENIQDNFASAKLGLLRPSILTDEEIRTYDIDATKLSHIRLGVAKYFNGSIVFAIKIPKQFKKFDKKVLLPISNPNKKQIDEDFEYIIEENNKTLTV